MAALKLKDIHIGLLLSFVATLCITWVGWNTGLFWDNVLFVHRFGTAIMENGLCSWGCIPMEHDPGHPMLTATYLAGIWSVFGKNLAVTHLALIPFIFLFCYALWSIIRFFFHDISWAIAAFVLVLSDPSVFCQLMYIGPEVLILCFSCIAIYGIVKQNGIYQTLGLMLLGITSLRGMMLCAGIFLWDLCKNHKVHISVYLLGALPAVSFIIWRLLTKGWIISNPLAPWGSAWNYTSVTDFLYNLVRNHLVLAFRIVDFGRFVPAFLILVLLIVQRKEWPQRRETIDLLLLTVLVCSVVAVTSLWIANPMGHNYFLWIYIGMELLLISLIQHLPWHKIGYSICLVALLLGNTIVYPERISQGWPCSLASLPYWSLRQDMLTYMNENDIAPEQTLTFFPMGACADDVDLGGDTRKYAGSWDTADYVIASNICNLDDETLDRLQKYAPIKRFKKRGVYIALYKITP